MSAARKIEDTTWCGHSCSTLHFGILVQYRSNNLDIWPLETILSSVWSERGGRKKFQALRNTTELLSAAYRALYLAFKNKGEGCTVVPETGWSLFLRDSSLMFVQRAPSLHCIYQRSSYENRVFFNWDFPVGLNVTMYLSLRIDYREGTANNLGIKLTGHFVSSAVALYATKFAPKRYGESWRWLFCWCSTLFS